MSKSVFDKKVNRRSFVKGAGILSAIAVASPFFGSPIRQITGGNVWADDEHGIGTFTEDYTAENVIYTTCEQCNTHCTIKAYVKEGKIEGGCTSLVRKIAGNPYSPLTMKPIGQIDYAKPAAAAALGGGSVAVAGRGLRGGRTCLKGQAGIQTAYDAYRLKKPMKRVGPRGSGQWKTISWEEAYNEIIEGSNDLGTPGLKDLVAYEEQDVVMADWDQVKEGTMSQEDFDAKYKDVLIDTKHPDFGPKVNQVACLGGDRRHFTNQRIWTQGLGSNNFDDHGGVCGVSSVIGNNRSFEHGKRRTYTDIDYIEYMIAFGTNPVVANKGPTWMAPQITNAIERGMKMAVVDSRMSKSAEKAHHWIPVIPGTDGAFALAMGRWIIEHERYDMTYLVNPNKAAAEADDEPTWSDATHLVKTGEPTRQKLKASELGLREEGDDDDYVVLKNGVPYASTDVDEADLEVDTTIEGIEVKSSFLLYKEEVMKHTMDEYAAITGIGKDMIEEVSREFTSHGKRAAAFGYRGNAMHTNGYYSVRAMNVLNHLIGNYDWKGGSISSGANFGPWDGAYDLDTVPNGRTPWGIPITRKQSQYEQSTLFERDGGYPALRPWFGATGNSSHELIPSAAEGYPYGLKALFVYRIDPILSFAAGYRNREVLQDESKIPLLVSLDITVGEAAQVSDFVLPDLTYLERYGQETIYPNQLHRLSSIMQPVTRVVPEAKAVEDVFIELAKRLDLPGVGENAFVNGDKLDSYEEYYAKMAANIAMKDEPVPDADAEEMAIFESARKKALGEFFDIERLKQAVTPEEWPKVVYMLNRGGRFEAPGSEYVNDGKHVKYQYGGQANFYDEVTARNKHSFSGEFYSGVPIYEAIKEYDETVYERDLPLVMTNWKAKHIGTHRQISNVWLREIREDNPLWMNSIDAKKRGLKNGDTVKIKGSDYEAEGRVMVTEGIRPGVVGSSYNFGHTAFRSQPIKIDGKWTGAGAEYGHTSYEFAAPKKESGLYAKGRDTGFSANNLLSIDGTLGNNGMFDPIGGASAQLYAKVEVEKG
ncbi:molybdopterin-dependent oxidoreductase [Salisediminibacterium selenitireducens]|uniref:Molybdopterin dinucleotide-binding region n=1 Tax=Bacillus selenitireducens (strain ATCC 700615 / DSM 15326 / MLS10) TaxID=439292 RepID=D6XY26_BACIE|nr:molybdopterin-dependent oxidoreductase [Salisediminibacterium selenitireducens]ADH98099.1 molybdopterin dinucleotide-binding region [[Bacillus] selenitireducens MLS10]